MSHARRIEHEAVYPHSARAGVACAGRSERARRVAHADRLRTRRSAATSSSRPAPRSSARSSGEVLEIDEPRLLRCRWSGVFGDTEVLFELFPEPDGTRLRVRHDGWDEPAVAERAGFDDGWKQKLDPGPPPAPGHRQLKGHPLMKTPPIVSAQEWDAALAADAGEGEGADASPRRTRSRTAPDAVAGRREGVLLRRTERHREPARPVRGSSAADRLPRVPRARCARLARPRVRRLLDGGRPGRARRAPQRARHHARVRVARAAVRHRAGEGAHGLGDALVHDDSTASTPTSVSTSGTAPTRSSATATACTARTSSTTAATRRWGAPGATSTSPRSDARRSGKTRPRATRRTSRTPGGSGTTSRPRATTTAPVRSSWRSPRPRAWTVRFVVTLAHIAGVPVEETLQPLAIALLLAGVKGAHRMPPETRALDSTPRVNSRLR